MIRFKTISFAAICFAAGVSFAAPSVRIDSMKQRYPWNGIVDVNYTISGADENHAYEVGFLARANGISKRIKFIENPHCKFTHDVQVTNGSFHVAWNAAELFPETYAADFEIYPTILDIGAESYPADATGEPVGIMASILVVDLSGGTSATNYPVEYYPYVDTGRFNCNVYKTSKMPMRFFNSGRYVVGYGVESQYSDNRVLSRAFVTASNHFYVAMFELTQGQYSRVCTSGCSGAVSGETYPASKNTIDSLRGSGSFLEAPSGENFFTKLNARTVLGSKEQWDLPTRSQWDIASRGNVLTMYIPGDSLQGVDAYALYNTTCIPVGMKLPNVNGLYDTNGNVWEAVLGYFIRGQCDPYAVDVPSMANSASTHICGGSWRCPPSEALNLAISSQYWWSRTSSQDNVGARAAIICR